MAVGNDADPGCLFVCLLYFGQAKYSLTLFGVGDKPKHTGEAKKERKKEFEPLKFEDNLIEFKLFWTVVQAHRNP